MVTQADIEQALRALGLCPGDDVLFHSSLKSFGIVDGGADTVIDAFLNVVTPSGTVIVPTLVQKNFPDAYQTWHMDKPSDVGYITEVFRKREGAIRSNQATHSVAAIGKNAAYYTETHGQSGLRPGTFGDSPFAQDSPWQKMYDNNVKVVMVGVDFKSLTFKHLFEYTMVEKALSTLRERGEYEKYASRVYTFDKRPAPITEYVWPSLSSPKIEALAEQHHLLTKTQCGTSVLTAMRIKEVGSLVYADVRTNTEMWISEFWSEDTLDWLKNYL